MPLLKDWGFCGPASPESSVLFDGQYAINLMPVPASGPNAKSKMALYGRPGLSASPFASINAPVRCLWTGNNRLFAVGGTHFYELNSGGSVITDYGAMAGSAGTGDAYAVANGTQLLVQDTSSAQIYNATGGAMVSVFNATALEYLDGFYIAIAYGASLAGSNPNQMNVSNAGDGSTWNALNYVIRTGAADLTTQLAVLNGQIWIFGQKATEIWYNAGNPLFPFARIQGATLNIGLLFPASVVKYVNTIMWVGSDDHGSAIVYKANGLQAQRVSNYAIEAYLNTLGSAIVTNAICYGVEEAGHVFYVMRFSAGLQLVYDLTTGLWHLRSYAAGVPQCAASIPNFNATNPIYVGDQNGKIWWQSLSYPNDGTGNAITYTRIAPHVADGNRWIRHKSLEIDADIGTAAIKLGYSNDGGRNFRTLARPDATLSGSSDQGGIAGAPTGKRYRWMQLGRSRDRVYRTDITDSANLIRITDAYLDVE